MISHGDFGIFVSRPVSLAFLLATLFFLVVPLVRLGWSARQRAGVSGAAAR
jgi:TctA family transporter